MCYKMSESMGCSEATLTSNDTYGGEIECTKCINETAIVTSSKADIPFPTICMPFDKLSHCLFYDKNDSIATSTFYCSLCEGSYWLYAGKFCVERQY